MSDSVGSTADSVHKRAPLPRQKDQNKRLLDKFTQEKLDSKSKFGKKRNDLSSGRNCFREMYNYLLTSFVVHYILFNSSCRLFAFVLTSLFLFSILSLL